MPILGMNCELCIHTKKKQKKPPDFIVKNASLFFFVVLGGNSFHSWKFHSLTIHWQSILNEWKLVPHPTSLDDFVVIPRLEIEKKTLSVSLT